MEDFPKQAATGCACVCGVIILLMSFLFCVSWYRAGVQQEVWHRQGVRMTQWEVFWGAKPVERYIVPAPERK
jgi:hypothetical protein